MYYNGLMNADQMFDKIKEIAINGEILMTKRELAKKVGYAQGGESGFRTNFNALLESGKIEILQEFDNPKLNRGNILKIKVNDQINQSMDKLITESIEQTDNEVQLKINDNVTSKHYSDRRYTPNEMYNKIVELHGFGELKISINQLSKELGYSSSGSSGLKTNMELLEKIGLIKVLDKKISGKNSYYLLQINSTIKEKEIITENEKISNDENKDAIIGTALNATIDTVIDTARDKAIHTYNSINIEKGQYHILSKDEQSINNEISNYEEANNVNIIDKFREKYMSPDDINSLFDEIIGRVEELPILMKVAQEKYIQAKKENEELKMELEYCKQSNETWRKKVFELKTMLYNRD